MIAPLNPKYSTAGKKIVGPGSLFNAAKAKLRTLASIPAGMRSKASVMKRAETAGNKILNKAKSPETRARAQAISDGVSVRSARGILEKAPAVTKKMMPIKGSFKKGGMVKKTGAYKLHKGEKVVPAGKVRTTGTYKGKSNKLGGGGRFAPVEAKAAAGGAKNPAAVAAAVGRKKYGAKKMSAMATVGRKRA